MTPPPDSLSDDYVRSQLTQLTKAVARQAEIEAERTGAARTTTRILTLFGSLITVAAAGGFVWLLEAETTTAHIHGELDRLEMRVADHDPPPVGHTEITDRLMDVETSAHMISDRLERFESLQAERHTELLEELRRMRRGGR